MATEGEEADEELGGHVMSIEIGGVCLVAPPNKQAPSAIEAARRLATNSTAVDGSTKSRAGSLASPTGRRMVALGALAFTTTLPMSALAAEPNYLELLERAKTVQEVDLVTAQAKAANQQIGEDDILANVLRAGTFEVCDADRDVLRATDKAAIDILVAKGTEAEKRAVSAFGPWSRSASRAGTNLFKNLTSGRALLDHVSAAVRPYYEAGGDAGSMPGNAPWRNFSKIYSTDPKGPDKPAPNTLPEKSPYFDSPSVGDSQRAYAVAEVYYSLAQSCGSFLRGDAKRRKAQAENLCGGFNEEGAVKGACFAYGVETAALSQVYIAGVDGTRWSSLVSVAVPFAGVRVPIDRVPYLSVDLMAYSAFLSFSNANTDAAKTAAAARGCSRADSEYETLLPCSSNPAVRPYFGFQAGATLGRSSVGYLNLSAVTGMTSVANLPGLFPYAGFSLSLPSLTGVL